MTKRAEELDRKIEGLKQSLQGLSLYTTAKSTPPALTKTEISIGQGLAAMMKLESLGPKTTTKTLTECCRDILAASGEWMSALQVRQGLHAANFDFSEYKSNPLSSIHTTLKRLAEGEEAWSATIVGDTLYKWRKKGEVIAPTQELLAMKPATPAPSPKARFPEPKTPRPGRYYGSNEKK